MLTNITADYDISQDLYKKVALYMSDEDQQQIKKAYSLALKAHKGQMRKSGEAYIYHPVEVAKILADLNLDVATICSALLHDCIEDTLLSKKEIEQTFGSDVAHIVDGVTKLEHLPNYSNLEKQADNFRKLFLAMSSDIRVILIKLSDRLHNMRTIDVMVRDAQRRIAKETLELHAPIAHRLGLNQFKSELEDLAFKTLYPYRYKTITNHISRKIDNQESFIKRMQNSIQKRFKEDKINASIYGRAKDSYSIFKKMRANHLRLKEVFDVYAFRIIVNELEDCYLALGSVHNLYKPLPGRFKDYIALPKENGYQSLHTVLFAPDGILVEVQIRSKAMDNIAKGGIAAHWYYKEKGSRINKVQPNWVNTLIEFRKNIPNSVEFLEAVKGNLNPNEIFVFTPKSDIIQLPYQSSVLDFAYALHTDIGNRCIGATIDNRPVTINTKLKSGQSISITTQKNIRPKLEWLDFVVTVKAKLTIKNELKKYDEPKLIQLGQSLLDNALLSEGFNRKDLNQKDWQNCLDYLGVSDDKNLFLQIGLGSILMPVVMSVLIGEENQNKYYPLSISKIQHLSVFFANCCHPLPGDKIIGAMSSGKGVVVHRKNCNNIRFLKRHQPQWINLSWEGQSEQTYTTVLLCKVENRRGVLSSIFNVISKSNINIENMSIDEQGHTLRALTIILSVSNLRQLEYVSEKIEKLKYIKSISRV